MTPQPGQVLAHLLTVVAAPGVQILVKDETRNHAGSHKQRAARAVVRAAITRGHHGLAVGSCGNYGLAIAAEAHATGLPVTVVLPEGWADRRLREGLTAFGAWVRYTPGGYEDAVTCSKSLAAEHGWADGNVDGDYAAEAMDALTGIADEIVAALPQAPSGVWVPLGNGTTAIAVAAGLRRRWPTVTVVGVTAAGANSILASWPGRRHTALPSREVAVTPVREPLVNIDALHGQECLDVLHRTAGRVIGVSDAHLLAAQQRLRVHGLTSSPSGAAGLAGLMTTRPIPSEAGAGTQVVVLTGR